MYIIEIEREEFREKFQYTMPPIVTKEIAWYATDDDLLIATILYDVSDKDYGYVILAPDQTGEYRCIEVDSSLSQDDAVKKCKEKLQEVYDTGEKVFPQ